MCRRVALEFVVLSFCLMFVVSSVATDNRAVINHRHRDVFSSLFHAIEQSYVVEPGKLFVGQGGGCEL